MGQFDWPTIRSAAEKLSLKENPQKEVDTLLTAIAKGDSECKIRCFCWLCPWLNKLDEEAKKTFDTLKNEFAWQYAWAKNILKQIE